MTPNIQEGKRYRITTRFPDGTIMTVEGLVIAVADRYVTIGRDDWLLDGDPAAGSTVTVERLRNPLPTQPGSVIYFLNEDDEDDKMAVLMWQIHSYEWVSVFSGKHIEDPDKIDFRVLFVEPVIAP